jgi:tellurite resistance-related uncharacterized protein
MTSGTSHGELPSGLELIRTTDEFDNDSVPAGLLRAHRVADGTWGRLVVRAGTMRFVFEDRADQPVIVGVGDRVVIPPALAHHVEFDGPACFVIEFHRLVEADST